VAGWEKRFGDYVGRLGDVLGHADRRAPPRAYTTGLLLPGERESVEPMAAKVDPFRVGAAHQSLHHFVAKAPWDDAALLRAVRDYALPAMLERGPIRAWLVDDTGLPKKGELSVGVARQYCGTLGKVGNCQLGVFLAYVSARGHALVDKRLYLPPAWTADPARCQATGVPAEVGYQSKAELGLAMLRQARAAGHLQGTWVAGDDAYGMVPTLREALAAEGWQYVLDVPATTPVFTQPAQTVVPPWSGRGRVPTKPRLAPGAPSPQTVRAVAAGLAPAAWQELTVAEGAQGPRTYQFAALRVWESRDGLPGRACWLVLRRNLDVSEPRSYLSNAPADTPLLTLAQVAAGWVIETEIQTAKGETGLDEYEVRSWAGWHHHITLGLLAAAFLLTLQQDWGEKDAPAHAPASQPRAARGAAPAHVGAGGPAALARCHPRAQRAGQTLTHQTSSPQAA
jgi:SRSO17 transposase